MATENSASTDDLNTILGGLEGDILEVTAFSGGNTVVLKDNVGNLRLQGDFSLDNNEDVILLEYISTGVWIEVSRSNNGD